MDIKKTIDHTLLKPATSAVEVRQLCSEAKNYGFYAVCVPPYFVGLAKQELAASEVKIATAIGFPYGYATTMAKVEEIKRAVEEGVDELDVLINLGALRSGDWNNVRADIDRMVTAVRLRGRVIKVIIESSILSQEELEKVLKICSTFKPDFVKTSTGLQGGATEEAIRQIRALLHPDVKIKASGGIRDFATAQRMLLAGANRLGTSSGTAIANSLP